MKVLIADDSRIYREVIKASLEQTGYELVQAENGDAAWAILQTPDAPRLAILDWHMPGLDGITICQRLRQRTSAPYVYSIIVTVKDSPEDVLEGLTAGADDFISKPFHPSELQQRLRSGARVIDLEDRQLAIQRELQVNNARLEGLYATAHKFVDNVSHEFRTPLTVITEYVSLIREGLVGTVSLDREQCRFLDVVADRADDLNTMVDDMLDVSKLEAGILSVWRQNCRVSEILQQVLPGLTKKSNLRKVSLDIFEEADLPEVFCDPEKAARVITNLAINALKFCGDPGQVQVRAENSPKERQVTVSVTDNGTGIDEANLKVIFERFQQLGSQSRGACKGFGLGLSIAKELVDANFGRLDVVSKEGCTTFSFTLPWAEPLEIVSRYLERLRINLEPATTLSVFEAQVNPSVTPRLADDAHMLLGCLQRHHDLLLRCDSHRWLYFSVGHAEVAEFMARITKLANQTNRNRPQGKLPDFAARSLGCWAIGSSPSEVMSCAREHCRPLETADA